MTAAAAEALLNIVECIRELTISATSDHLSLGMHELTPDKETHIAHQPAPAAAEPSPDG